MAEFKNIIHNQVVYDGAEENKRLRADLEKTQEANKSLRHEVSRCHTQLETLKHDFDDLSRQMKSWNPSGDTGFEKRVSQMSAAMEKYVASFKIQLQALNLNDKNGTNDSLFQARFEAIRNGAETVSEALVKVKSEYAHLLEANYQSAGASQATQSIDTVKNSLASLEATVNSLSQKITSLVEDGVKVANVANNATDNGLATILKQIEVASANATGETKTAYSSITQLVEALTKYGSIDAERIASVSYSLGSLSSIGSGNFNDKKIENIISLVTRLQGLASGGDISIGFDVNSLNNLKVSKASLNNLATYLPQIEKVNASKLKALSNVDLTNFNNIKVSKGSLEAIAQLTQALQLLKETKAATTDVSNGAITIDASNAKAQTEALSQASQEATRATQEEIANVQRLRQETENLTATTQNRSTVQSGVAQAASHQAKQEVAETKAKEAAVKQYYIVLTQIETAIRNYTSAEHSSKNGSKEAYAALVAQRDALRQLNGAVSSGTIKTDALKSATSKASETLKASTSTIKANGDATKTWSERIGTLGAKFGTWFSITRVIMYVIRAIRQMISASVELDSAMGQMQIVTKSTESQMNKFADSAANAAKRIGSSITDFVSSATTFARLGYSMDESSQLAEFTAMLQNVGDIDVKDAQDAITSIVKAFDIGTDQIESVMDKLVEVGNNYPVSVSDLAQGMTNASSALAAAGNSFEQSIALLTAANTTINLCRAA